MPPLRQVTRKYLDLESFFQDYNGTLAHGALLIPADQVPGGELAPELKLDLQLPLVGRVGPMNAQVVSRLPDGSFALRVPEVPASVSVGLKKVVEAVEEVRRFLVSRGELVPASDVATLRAELEALRQEGSRAPPELGEGDDLIDDLPSEPAPAPLPVAPPPPAPTPPAPPPAPRAPPPPRVHGLPLVPLVGTPVAKGALGDAALRRALVSLAMAQETGALQVTTPDQRVRVGYWRAGGPVAWRSDPPVEDERLGRLLLKSGQLDEAQLRAAENLMEQAQIRQGEALVRMGVVPAASLPLLLARQAELILMRVLQEKAGTWAFYRLGELPEAFPAPPIAVASLLTRALLNQSKKVPAPQLKAALKKLADKSVYLRAEAVASLRDGKYAREEAAVLDALRVAPQPLVEFTERGPAPFEIVGPIVWTLLELGLAETGKGENREAATRRAVEAIDNRLRLVEKGSPFDALDLHWICLPEEVQRNHQRIKGELSPSVLGELPTEQAQRLSALLSRLDTIAAQLQGGPARQAARRRLIASEDLERCAELLRAASAEARAAGDEARARIAAAKADDLTARA